MAYQGDEKRAYQRAWIAKRRTEYVIKFGGVCSKCGCDVALEFHHLDRLTKVEHRVWSWSIERINNELNKCCLLCRKCHFDETAKERNFYSAPHGSLTSYTNYNCRCKHCRKARSDYERTRRRVRMCTKRLLT